MSFVVETRRALVHQRQFMRDYWTAFVLGAIEGLTEFLPVSATAHLRIAEALLGIDARKPFWVIFLVSIQLGAMLGLLGFYFLRRDVLIADSQTEPFGQSVFKNIAIAFASNEFLALLFIVFIHRRLESFQEIGLALIGGGIVMGVADIGAKSSPDQPKSIGTVTVSKAIWIGLCQSISEIFSGVSHSMATITCAQIVGVSRSSAVQFSYLLFIPTMFATTGLELLHEGAGMNNEYTHTLIRDGHQIAVLAIGFLAASIVAYITANWFFAWVQKRGLFIFSVYRIGVGFYILLYGISRPF